MNRHSIPVAAALVTLVGCFSSMATRAEAQTAIGDVSGGGILNDPFAFYYAIYLPNQQLQALRPTPLDSVNDAMVSRQYFSQTNRRGLSDPISPYAETYDPLRPYSSQQERLANPFHFQRQTSNNTGTGPSLYYNRITQYYPDLAQRNVRHQNANVATTRRASTRGRGGMGGMGGGGMGGGGMGGGGMGMF